MNVPRPPTQGFPRPRGATLTPAAGASLRLCLAVADALTQARLLLEEARGLRRRAEGLCGRRREQAAVAA